MSAWIIASLILATVLLLVTPVASTWQLPGRLPAAVESGFSAAPLPVSQHISPPPVSARNIFIMDRPSKSVLLAQNADQQIFPASTTKMMTALVALDHFQLAETITVTQAYKIGQVVGFKPGESLTVEQLLYALLVQSGNDAAEILAENFPGGRSAFVAAMNQKARDIHLTNTHFVNPTGVDEAGLYSTAADLARLADVALRQPTFAKIVATENAVISTHVLTNVNQLLGKIPGVLGVKTGYTEGAGQALVTLVQRNDHPVILAVLESKDRFADSAALIDWVYSNWRWENPAGQTGRTGDTSGQ